MRFASFQSFALLAIVPFVITSCTPEIWAPALEESLPNGTWVEGLYALNPEGESLTFDGFDPMVLGNPNLPHTLHIRLRQESNHAVTYSEVSAFAFLPADVLLRCFAWQTGQY